MYSDDMVLFAESEEGLQSMLNSLLQFSKNNGLTVNIAKTKIVVFRNAGTVRKGCRWLYNDQCIEIVDQFNYLDLLLNYNGKFNITQNKLAEQGRKAVYSLKHKTKKLCLNVPTMLSVFNTYVNSVFYYGCEIWGANKAMAVEKVQLDFCKRLLNVKNSTTNAMVYCELDVYPLIVMRKYRIIKYWYKLLNTNNCILEMHTKFY